MLGFGGYPTTSILNDPDRFIVNVDSFHAERCVTYGDLVANIKNSIPFVSAKFILQTADASLPNAQALDQLENGLLKQEGGVVERAIPNVDYALPGSSPPSGPAGGDLTGFYPNPALITALPSPPAYTNLGSSTRSVTIQADQKGRVIGLSDSAISFPHNAFSTSVTNIADLRLTSAPSNKDVVFVEGYYYEGDGGGGLFYWDSSSTDADNNGTVIKITAVATGRYFRSAPSQFFDDTKNAMTLDVRWFGAIPFTPRDAAPNIEDAYKASLSGQHVCLYFPGGIYQCTTSIDIDGSYAKYVTLKGDGIEATRILYSGTASGLLSIQEAASMSFVQIMDMEIVSDQGYGSGQEAYAAFFIAASEVRIASVKVDSLPNIITFKLIKCSSRISNLYTNNAAGTQLWVEGGNIMMRDFSLASGKTPGSAGSAPALVVRCDDSHGSMTSCSITDGYIKGAGPWTPYDGGTADIEAVIEGNYGTINEGRISNILFDSVDGNDAGSVALLFNAQNASYDLATFILSDLWLNGGVIGLKLLGVDQGGSKTIREFTCNNIMTRPDSSNGVELINCLSIKLDVFTAPVSSLTATGVYISASGNDASDFNITGSLSTSGESDPSLTGITFNGTKVKHATVWATIEGATNAYTLTGGANKATQALVVNWPDGSGGMNCSGTLTQNV